MTVKYLAEIMEEQRVELQEWLVGHPPQAGLVAVDLQDYKVPGDLPLRFGARYVAVRYVGALQDAVVPMRMGMGERAYFGEGRSGFYLACFARDMAMAYGVTITENEDKAMIQEVGAKTWAVLNRHEELARSGVLPFMPPIYADEARANYLFTTRQVEA